MLFNSFQFLYFFIVVWVAFLAMRGTPRKVFLLVASYYFYMCWNAKYILVILAITLIDYVAGIQIEQAKTSGLRRIYLGVSLFCNLGLLVVFKYFNFLAGTISSLASNAGMGLDVPLLNIILPVGLSFHTFQAMSYTLDLYKGKVPAERNFLNYALYVAFFPQMVAGPIERPNQLLPQFHREPEITAEKIKSGVAQTLWGLFKKMVIADSLASFVNMVYASPQQFNGVYLLLATCFFALQIYCDFSGYSDIALGIARIMGYELRINFQQPYFSRSIGEFWRRWHISLSSWFRDYVYIPLGGNRVSKSRHYLNLMATFAISGLWHGASWTFVMWGILHGSYQIMSQMTQGLRSKVSHVLGLERFPRLVAVLQVFVTFTLVTIAWVFFRASSIQSAFYIITHFFPLGHFESATLSVGKIPRANTPFLAVFIALLFVVEWLIAHPSKIPTIWRFGAFRKACYYSCAFSLVFFGVFGHTDFIYFQF
ncbi:MBOAT family O-acyltransferase [Nevskia soli]|uniref:MBOAT family O-acyltransferase n=1 Tax=Nevskia soli TaxID=418856 RepID=UPI0004A6C772|nr:MBOAT family O-acyltransferase [Nevskia soli]